MTTTSSSAVMGPCPDGEGNADSDTVPGTLTGITTPAEMLASVAAHRDAVRTHEVGILALAVEWAHAHPCLPVEQGGTGRPVSWRAPQWGLDAEGGLTDGGPDLGLHGVDVEDYLDFGLPPVDWSAPAGFAAANGVSTPVGREFIRDALTLRHRLPRTWAQVLAGRCPVHRARRVAAAVLGRPADVAEFVDDFVSAQAGGIGAVILDRIIDQAMLALHPEDREVEQLEAREACYVRLSRDQLNATLGEVLVRGDWTDLADFDAAVSHLAAALAVLADADPHGPYQDLVGTTSDVRRARAVGILAHPQDAIAILAAAQDTNDARSSSSTDLRDRDDCDERAPGRRPGLPIRKQIVLHLHLSEAAVAGTDVVATDHAQRAIIADQVAAWCGRPDAGIVVKPIQRPTAEAYGTSVPGHEAPDWMRELVHHRDPFCVFPHCTRPSRDCDLDHIEEWRPGSTGGPTNAQNLAPLCRHHHNLKTPTGRHLVWNYEALAPAVYLWTDPHGNHYLHTRDGTSALGPPRPPTSA